MYNTDSTPGSKTYIYTIPETENTYECLHGVHANECMDGIAPSNRPTEAEKSSGRESLYRKISLVLIFLWLVTLATIIIGLVLYYGQRSTIQRELEVLKSSSSILPGGTPKVAFTASLANHTQKITVGPYSETKILIYTYVLTNVGGAYDSSTGIFTAPIRGIYYFSITAFGWNSGTPVGVSLYLNHEFYQSVYDNKPGPGRGATNMITLQLGKGDILYIKLWANMQLHDNGNLYNTFSGHLLFPN